MILAYRGTKNIVLEGSLRPQIFLRTNFQVLIVLERLVVDKNAAKNVNTNIRVLLPCGRDSRAGRQMALAKKQQDVAAAAELQRKKAERQEKLSNIKSSLTPEQIRVYREHFELFDLNGDGVISARELRKVSRQMGYRLDDSQIEVSSSSRRTYVALYIVADPECRDEGTKPPFLLLASLLSFFLSIVSLFPSLPRVSEQRFNVPLDEARRPQIQLGGPGGALFQPTQAAISFL